MISIPRSPSPRRGRPSRLRRSRRSTRGLTTIAALVLTLGLVACDSSADPPADATSAPTASVTPGAPPPPMTDATPSATPTPGAPAGSPYGLAVVDVETGVATTLHEDDSAFFLARAHAGPILDAGGTAWVSPGTERSFRYDADGGVVEEIEGWAVLEAPDGSSRSYFTGDDPSTTLIVESGDERHELPAGDATWRAYSPDSTHLAWTAPTSPAAGALHLLEIASGEITELATGVEPPLSWSPSGRFLAYGTAAAGQTTILEVAATGGTLDVAGQLTGRDPWVDVDGTEWLVTVDTGGARLTSTDSDDDAVDLPLPGADDLRVLATRYVVITTGTGPQQTTVVYDTTDASRALELQGAGDVAVTPAGLASAVIARTELACTGIEIVHPLATQELPCEADDLRWSPDGRFLALIPASATAPVELFDLATEEVRELPHAGPRGSVPSWSADGRYLIWTWMPQP